MIVKMVVLVLSFSRIFCFSSMGGMSNWVSFSSAGSLFDWAVRHLLVYSLCLLVASVVAAGLHWDFPGDFLPW